VTLAEAFSNIPAGLRDLLLSEYQQIVQNHAEHRWSDAELKAGKFCEIVYSILVGHASNSYPAKPAKPSDFVGACRALEKNKSEPRSFQILIPRMLLPLYEVRNNRGVGHVGGDVDPNHMDANVVLSMCNWVMAELVRVLHAVTIEEAQAIVDSLAERRIPLVWQDGDLKRVLDPKVSVPDQVLILIASSSKVVRTEELRNWIEAKDKSYFMKALRLESCTIKECLNYHRMRNRFEYSRPEPSTSRNTLRGNLDARPE
jgi:hypothetical protein